MTTPIEASYMHPRQIPTCRIKRRPNLTLDSSALSKAGSLRYDPTNSDQVVPSTAGIDAVNVGQRSSPGHASNGSGWLSCSHLDSEASTSISHQEHDIKSLHSSPIGVIESTLPPNNGIFFNTDVFLALFKFLEPATLAVAARVCRHWHSLSTDPSLWRDLMLHGRAEATDAALVLHDAAVRGKGAKSLLFLDLGFKKRIECEDEEEWCSSPTAAIPLIDREVPSACEQSLLSMERNSINVNDTDNENEFQTSPDWEPRHSLTGADTGSDQSLPRHSFLTAFDRLLKAAGPTLRVLQIRSFGEGLCGSSIRLLMRQIGRRCPSLRVLRVTCRTYDMFLNAGEVTPRSWLDAITIGCPQLKVLDVSPLLNHTGLSEIEYLWLETRLPCLETITLVLEKEHDVPENVEEEIEFTKNFILGSPNLRHLELHNATDGTLPALATESFSPTRKIPVTLSLRSIKLHVRDTAAITPHGLAQFVAICPHLENVGLICDNGGIFSRNGNTNFSAWKIGFMCKCEFNSGGNGAQDFCKTPWCSKSAQQARRFVLHIDIGRQPSRV